MKQGSVEKIFDVVVIGGGPAGMMAAGRAAERRPDASILLLEKNPTLGKKLLITGGGRCNVTNNRPDIRTMLEKYSDSGKFLFSAFSQFAVTDALSFFNSRGMLTKEEAFGRMFPVSDKAQSVWNVLNSYIQSGKVEVKTNAPVATISHDPDAKLFTITLKNSTVIRAISCIVATGGTSRPETGSTGDGFVWLKKLGHTVIENDFALVPIALSDAWVKKLGGVTLADCKLTIVSSEDISGASKKKKRTAKTGRLLFTHFGISGPTVLNMSKEVGEMLEYGDVTIMLDLFPKLDPGAMKETVQKILVEQSNKKIKNVLADIIPAALSVPILELTSIDPDTPCHSVRTEQRKELVSILKAIPLHVKALLGANKAIISSGGVSLDEVDFKTMESRKVPKLYGIGDVLNIDRPSGGYSLQLCWTTGFVAGEHA